MAKVELDNIGTGFASTSKINSNNDKIEDILNNKVLWRDNPAGEPNQMESNLDLNDKDVLNVKSLGATSITLNGQILTVDGTGVSTLPDQSGQAGKLLTTNGSAASWATPDASQIAYDEGGTGSTATTVEGALSRRVSLSDYASVQEAVDAHSVLYVDQIYTLTAPIELPTGRDTTFIGKDRSTCGFIAGAAITDTTATLFKVGNVANVSLGTDTETITFKNLSIDSNGATYPSVLYGCNIQGVKDVVVENCKAVNSITRGMMFQANVGTTNISNSLFNNTGVQGVYSKGPDQSVLIEGCTFDNCGVGSPAYLEDGKIAVRNSVFVNCDQGPQIRKGSGSSNNDHMGEISGCFVLNPTGNGIVVGNSMQRFIVANNTVLRNNPALVNEFAYNIDVTQPGPVDCHGIVKGNIAMALNGADYDDGFRFTGVQHCIITNNQVVGTSRYGIFANSECSDLNIDNNMFEAYAGDGLNIQCSDVVVKNNTFKPASTGQDYVRFSSGTTNNMFINNICFSTGNVATSSTTSTFVEDNIFPDRVDTDTIYQFSTRPDVKNETILEVSASITLAGAVYDQIVVDTTSGNLAITLGDIDVVGRGQGFYIHKTVAANSLSLTADTSEEVDDGTTNGNNIALFADTETGVARVISGESAGTNVWYVVDKIVR